MNDSDIILELKNNNIHQVISKLNDVPERVNITNELGQSVFWLACSFGDLDLVKFCLEPKIKNVLDYRKKDKQGRDALDAAELYEQATIVDLIGSLYGVNTYPDSVKSDYGIAEAIHYKIADLAYDISKHVSPSQLLAGGLLTLIGLFSVTEWNSVFLQNETRMVAKADGGIDIDKSVARQLEAKVDLTEVIKTERIEYITLKKDEILDENGYLTVSCNVVIQLKTGETNQYDIIIENHNEGEFSINQNIDELRAKYKSSREKIFEKIFHGCI